MLAAVLVYLNRTFEFDRSALPGTRAYFANELRALGAMTRAERWVLGLFAAATVLSFSRGLLATRLPAFTPAFAFLACGLLTFVVQTGGHRLLDWDYAQSKMMWGLFYVFAGGNALGTVLAKTGTARYIATAIVPYASHGSFSTVAIFAGLTITVAQIVSNVASVAIMVPIAVSVCQALHLNPIPFVYVVIASGHCGFMLPSSAGSSAVAAGYGINLQTMFVKGFWAALICLIAIIITAYVSLLFWPGFGRA